MSSLPFLHRPPTPEETERLRLAFSTFGDGSGMIMQDDGTTLPGWRDFERAIASVLCGTALEGKQLFDVFVPCRKRQNVDYGISVKSKELSRTTAISDLGSDGRVYMELANSPAKFWEGLEGVGIDKSDFGNPKLAQKIGQTIVATVQQWHHEAQTQHTALMRGRTLDLDNSIYLTVSYSKPRPGQPRRYQLHSFRMAFPPNITWRYRPPARAGEKPKSIAGYDPQYPGEVLFDWYPFSGGQLKYYPRASSAMHFTSPFELASTPLVDIANKAARCFPREWIAANGLVALSASSLADEISTMSLLASAALTDGSHKILKQAVDQLLAAPPKRRRSPEP